MFKKDFLCDFLKKTIITITIRFHLKFFWAHLLKKELLVIYHTASIRDMHLWALTWTFKGVQLISPIQQLINPATRPLGLVPTLHLTVETADSRKEKWQTRWHKLLRGLDRATWWFMYRSSFALKSTAGQFDPKAKSEFKCCCAMLSVSSLFSWAVAS